MFFNENRVTPMTRFSPVMAEYRTIVYNAARDGNLKRLKVFLDGRSDDDVKVLLESKCWGAPVVLIAARNGHYDVLKYLIDTRKDVVNLRITGTVEFDGDKIAEAPPVWAAAAAGHLLIVKLLLENGADVNQTTASSSTALRGACYDGHLNVVEYLCEQGADVEICNQYGHSPLMIAAYREKADCVSYLLARHARVNHVSLKGNTALHDAAECGSLTIVDMLIKAGATLQKDEHGITPVMSAAMIGHDTIVDYFADNKHKFEESIPLSEIIDAYKLLGATCIDKRRELTTAIGYWRKAIRLTEQCSQDDNKANDSKWNDALGDDVKPSTSQQKSVGPPAVYRQEREMNDGALLEEITTDPDALRMQALVIRERVLGGRHPETHYYLRYRGAIYADIGQYTRCFQLWLHALRLQQECLDALNPVTQATIMAFAEIFSYMLNDRSIAGMMVLRDHGHGGLHGQSPSFDDIFVVLQLAVNEIERGKTKGNEHGPCNSQCHGRVCVVSLYLVSLIGRLDQATIKTDQNDQLLRTMYRLVQLKPIVCDGGNLLHAACSEDTSALGKYPPTRFPSLYVLKILIQVGADINAIDSKGRSPLHIVLGCKTPRLSMIKYLLQNGAHVDLREKNGTCAYDLIVRKPRVCSEIQPWDRLTLKCLAATVIRRRDIPYDTVVPQEMHAFIAMH